MLAAITRDVLQRACIAEVAVEEVNSSPSELRGIDRQGKGLDRRLASPALRTVRTGKAYYHRLNTTPTSVRWIKETHFPLYTVLDCSNNQSAAIAARFRGVICVNYVRYRPYMQRGMH